MAKELIALNPNDGQLLWEQKYPTQYGLNNSTPVFDGKDRIFLSSAYGNGSRGIRLVKEKGRRSVRELWFNPRIQLHFTNALVLGNYVYGSNGFSSGAFVTCINLSTGEIVWRERGFHKANFLFADNKAILLDQDGVMALATLSLEGMQVLSRCNIVKPYAWSAPTLVGSTLYLRDRTQIMALDLR